MAIFRYFSGCAGQERVKIGSRIFYGKSLDCRKNLFLFFPPQTWKRKEKMCKSKSIGIVEEIKKSFFPLFFVLTEAVGASVCLSSYEIPFYILSHR
jgi:hypothetical protein